MRAFQFAFLCLLVTIPAHAQLTLPSNLQTSINQLNRAIGNLTTMLNGADQNITVYLEEITSIGNNISASLTGLYQIAENNVPAFEQNFSDVASAIVNVSAVAIVEVPTVVQSVQEAAGAIENISILAQNNVAEAQKTAKEAADAMQTIADFTLSLRKNAVYIALASFGVLAGGITSGILTAKHILVFKKEKNALYKLVKALRSICSDQRSIMLDSIS